MSDIFTSSEPARPANMTSQIDALVAGTLPGASNVRVNRDGTTESLPSPENVMSRSGDVAPPALDDLMGQMQLHGKRIADIDKQLNAQVFNRDTGQPEGFRVTGKDREQLITHRQRAVDEQAYIIQRTEETREARIAYNQKRAAREVGGPMTVEPTVEAVKAREAAIRELSEMPGHDGKPIGRGAAQREYNAAQLRARADKLARGL